MPEASRMTYLESELDLPSLDSARFCWEGRNYSGRPCLDQDLEEELLASESSPDDYGHKLFNAVFPVGSELREGLRGALLAAERDRSRLRLLLHLSPNLPDWVHGLYWELLTDPERRLPLACSPDTAFSRYLDVREALGAPATGRPRLLCVIAAPSNIRDSGLAEIRRDEVVRRLEADLRPLSGAVELEILEPPVTLERLRERLMAEGGVHILHFFGHGHSRAGSSHLVLEDEQGRSQFVREEVLANAFLGVRELRLVTLVACHGSAPSSSDPFSGLAGRLVQGGLSAVIAMRRAVSFETAFTFTRHFYRQLSHTGQVDAAVNEARHQLHLARHLNRHRRDNSEIDWSSPVLYSRLKDGRLWPPRDLAPEEEAVQAEPGAPLLRVAPRRLLQPLPWLPALCALLLLVLGLLPAPQAEARLDLWVSRLSFRLAKNSTVVERLRLEEIAATRLAALRLPSRLPAPTRWGRAGSRGMQGFFLAAQDRASASVTLNALPLAAGTEVVLEHQEGNAYRLSFDGSDQELKVTFQGDVLLKPLNAPVANLHLEYPGSLVLYPQSRALDLDVVFSRFAQDEIASEIPIDELALRRVVEQHTARQSMVREESTLLAGEVNVRATSEKYSLKKGESLRFAALDGSLTGLRLGADGIRAGFQGRVSKLERVPDGFKPEDLMPSVLDLWISGPPQRALQAASGALAVLVLIFTVLEIRPRQQSLPRLPAGTRLNPDVN